MIDEASKVTQRNHAAKLKHHQPSQSLIVTASEDNLRLVSEVVDQMEKVRTESEQAEQYEARDTVERLQLELDLRQVEIEQLRQQISGLSWTPAAAQIEMSTPNAMALPLSAPVEPLVEKRAIGQLTRDMARLREDAWVEFHSRYTDRLLA